MDQGATMIPTKMKNDNDQDNDQRKAWMGRRCGKEQRQ